jgi:hypothetical protein
MASRQAGSWTIWRTSFRTRHDSPREVRTSNVAVDRLDARPVLRLQVSDLHEQQPDDAGPADVEQTPVAGSTSSTWEAAAISPASHAVIDRTCSYPVANKKVGARP